MYMNRNQFESSHRKGHGQITRDSSDLVKLKEEKLRKETKKIFDY